MPSLLVVVGIGWLFASLFAVALCAVAKRSDIMIDRIRQDEAWRDGDGLEPTEQVSALAS